MSISQIFRPNDYSLHCSGIAAVGGNITCADNITASDTIRGSEIIKTSLIGGGITPAAINNDGELIRASRGYGFFSVKANTSLSSGVGAPSFTIGLGAFSEGTWVKTIGLVASGFEQGCTFSSGTWTVNLTGKWLFRIDGGCLRGSGGGDRDVFMSFERNVSDSNQSLATYSPSSVALSINSSNDLSVFTGAEMFDLTAGDTIKLFTCMINPTGTAVQNLEVYSMSVTCAYFGP